jgi:hypothetical protein
VNLQKFGGVGERVEGTFWAASHDGRNNITNGFFSVVREDLDYCAS